MVNLCVPTLNRYDLLSEMLLSANAGTLKPTTVWIINNGRNLAAMQKVLLNTTLPTVVYTPRQKLGLAESWNWFLRHVPDNRLIVNDDIIFGPDSIEKLMFEDGHFITALIGTNAFSCFVLRNGCRQQVGLFDETISPGYAYWEDVDYAWRMEEQHVEMVGIECGVVHHGSQTIKKFNEDEKSEHNRRFMIAQENFIKKWGKLPADRERQRYGQETKV